MANRLKNIPWRFFGSLCLGLIGLAGLVLLMGLVTKKDSEQVCSDLKVIVEGKETFIDQADIMAIVKEQYGVVIGRPLNEIPLEKIERSLMDLPYVSAADVYVDMNGGMKISVKQRAIVLRVINKVGQEFYVDTEWKKIPTTLKYVPHVMIANGNISESFAKPLEEVESKMVRDLVRIVHHSANDELWGNQIVQLYVNNDQDIEIVPRVGDQEIIIGSADDLADKLKRVEVFYKKILPKVGTEAYDKVNVKYSGQIICERHDGWFIDSLQMKMNR